LSIQVCVGLVEGLLNVSCEYTGLPSVAAAVIVATVGGVLVMVPVVSWKQFEVMAYLILKHPLLLVRLRFQ
jgi:hypothetical protein